ncbi:type I toxin-antitoxin system SymE family toxin [Leclercia adecarboxylata]|nr:type I toxin-antitoxin system SymE family toxin [Leclercia adecarboxylata]
MIDCCSRNPSLRLNDNGLAEAVFSNSTPVTVSVEHGQLLIASVKG